MSETSYWTSREEVKGKGWLHIAVFDFQGTYGEQRAFGRYDAIWVHEECVEARPYLGMSAVSSVPAPSTNALEELGITRGICDIHAERHLGKLKQYFQDHSAAKQDLMRADIESAKAFPFEQYETDQSLQSRMMKKWSNPRGIAEKAVAMQWSKGWISQDWKMLRVSLNSGVDGAPPGGLPCDNQGLEAKNGAQKKDKHWKRQQVTDVCLMACLLSAQFHPPCFDLPSVHP